MITRNELERFYGGRRVLVTGHTGFKGAWLSLALAELGAVLTGVALSPDDSGAYELADVGRRIDSHLLDIREASQLAEIVRQTEPEVVFHLAAQSLVPRSFTDPVGTFDVNVVGTASVLAACSAVGSVEALIAVTSDKVYANAGTGRRFIESDPLGGGDPYSASKAAAEIVVESWRHSFAPTGTRVATARAGNVIGGGDRAPGRIVPDVIRAMEAGEPVQLRNPDSIRPWQHVFEPVVGYLGYAAKLGGPNADQLAPSLNFGPGVGEDRSVRELVDLWVSRWGSGSWVPTEERPGPEAPTLSLDSTEALRSLGWRTRLGIEEAVDLTVEWHQHATTHGECVELSTRQLVDYLAGAQ